MISLRKKFVLMSICVGFIGCTKAPVLKVYSLNVPSVGTTQSSIYSSKSIKLTLSSEPKRTNVSKNELFL
ncbi:MAG: hypothetical protein Q9M39_01920 [Sulfurovum sp.]|nr:hypothetical protein [Sulfurovum sp.]